MGTEILNPQDCLIRQVPSLSLRKPHPNPNPHPKPFKKRRSPRAARNGSNSFIMGQVTILKRGESLNSSSASAKKKKATIESLISDPEVFVPGLDQIRVVAYAGSAFSTSPSPLPRSLPLPKFSRRKEGSAVLVDISATIDLRRLLRLD